MKAKINPGMTPPPPNDASKRVQPNTLGQSLNIKDITFNAEHLVGYLNEPDVYLHPNEVEIENYNVDYIAIPEAWYISRKAGGKLLLAIERNCTTQELQYFVYQHNNITGVRVSQIFQDTENKALLYEIELNNHKLFFFNEMSAKSVPQLDENDKQCKLTAFVTKIDSVTNSTSPQAAIISLNKTEGTNLNEYKIQAKILRQEGIDSFQDEGFYIYSAEINIAGQKLELPLVINNSRIFNYTKNCNPFTPGSIIDCNVILQGHFVS